MSTEASGTTHPVRRGDVVITLVLLAIFVVAYLTAQEWPFRARLFPDLLSIAGMALAVAKLVTLGVQASRHRKAQRDIATPATPSTEGQTDHDKGEDHSAEYVFGRAGRRAWTVALGWVAAFFIALGVVGVYVTVPVFSFVYLKVSGKTSWLGAAIYAAVAGSVLWVAFSYLLQIPMPTGIF